MATRTVTAPGGDVWRVRRVWAPRLQGETLWARAWRRMRSAMRRSGDLADVADPGCVDDLVVGLVVLMVAAAVLFVGLPLLLALLDVVVVVLLTLLGVMARVVFRRPWQVEAVGPDRVRHTWRVAGWRASGEAVDDIAGRLGHGQPLPAGADARPLPGRRAEADPASTEPPGDAPR